MDSCCNLRAGQQFDALITMDSGIEFQHNLLNLPCSVIILEAPTNKLVDLLPKINGLLDVLEMLKSKSIVRV